jgi:hypothetical protein
MSGVAGADATRDVEWACCKPMFVGDTGLECSRIYSHDWLWRLACRSLNEGARRARVARNEKRSARGFCKAQDEELTARSGAEGEQREAGWQAKASTTEEKPRLEGHKN